MKSVRLTIVLAPLTMLGMALVGGCATQAAKESAPSPAASAAPAPAPVAAKPEETPESKAVADNKVDIDFPEGSAVLTDEANKQLDLAARLYRDAHPIVMFTSGHTDNKGNEYNNVILSARRAEAVKRGLVERGIPADLLYIQALGESEPADAADPLAAANRRVTITWKLSKAT
jgi:OOP family OmpA-OmpF porin